MSLQTWMILGAALLALELLLIDAQFYLVFLGLAAITTGGLLWAGLPVPPLADWPLFGVLALAYTFGFRRRLYAKLRARQSGELDAPFSTGTAMPAASIAAGKEGPVHHNGSPWTEEYTYRDVNQTLSSPPESTRGSSCFRVKI